MQPGWKGRFFENFTVGDVCRHPLGRTVSEADNTWFALLTMSADQMHFNRQYAHRSEFGRPIVVSTLTVANAVGQGVTDLTQNAFANLGWDDIRMTHPVFAGDTLWSESPVLSKRESSSRPHAGIVSVRTHTINQDGVEVCSFRRTCYVYRRGAGQVAEVFPNPVNPLTLDGESRPGRRRCCRRTRCRGRQRMTLRVTYRPWGESLSELLEAALAAERAGAEVVWVPQLRRSPTIPAAPLAFGTCTAQVGTAVALAFTRSPMITALEAVDLDELSGGRLILGLANGVRRLNEEWHDVMVDRPAGRLRDTLDCIRTFWRERASGRPIEAGGRHAHLQIRGYQRPFAVARTEIPIYVGAMGPALTALAGEVVDGYLSHEPCSPAWLSEHILPDLRRGLLRAGRDPSAVHVVVSACCSIDADPALARRRAAGLVGFYASVRSYADFFAFHDLAANQAAAVISAPLGPCRRCAGRRSVRRGRRRPHLERRPRRCRSSDRGLSRPGRHDQAHPTDARRPGRGNPCRPKEIITMIAEIIGGSR